jgi:heme-degrading monooxygenase HmoA
MSVFVTWTIPGATEEHYLAAFRAVDDPGDSGEDHIAHIAGPTADGWFVTDVWPSEERFREWFDAADLAGCWRRAGVELPEPVVGPVFHSEPPFLKGE